MAALMVLDELNEVRGAITRLGGQPLAPAGFAWPVCAICKVPMQFIGQFRLRDANACSSDGLVLVWMCFERCSAMALGHAPEASSALVQSSHMYDEHLAVTVPTGDLRLLDLPAGALPRARPPQCVTLVPFEADYEQARFSSSAYVLGRVGGEPSSASGFVPMCVQCSSEMKFVAEVEEGGDDARFNFNGTTAFVYACAACEQGAFFVDDRY